jgi:hypothetical protein
MFHPALGIHEPKKMLYIRADWHRLGRYLKGNLPLVTDPCAGVEDYREVTDVEEVEALDAPLLGCDTESRKEGTPFCFTYSDGPGRGRLIRADRPDLLAAFGAVVTRRRTRLLFHNWLYDWPVVESMGLTLPHQSICDTMALAFHLGTVPQGLKALAFRELGMTMRDFDDVVSPYSRLNVLHYFELMRMTDWGKPEEELTQDSKTGKWKLYRPQSLNTKMKRFFTDLAKNPEGKDIFGAWDNWAMHHAAVVEELGPYPGKCISHVPFHEALHYACRDADATLRIYRVLRQMKTRVRRYASELWRAA